MALTIDLRVESDDWQIIPDLDTVCQRALEIVFDKDTAPAERSLDVLLTGDGVLAELNQQWRGKSSPTDVLSFPAEANPEGFLGDIAIAYGVAARDAKSTQKTLSAHLSHLLIHGLLHLLGHDHIEDSDAERMETLEKTALAKLGIADPYSRIAQA